MLAREARVHTLYVQRRADVQLPTGGATHHDHRSILVCISLINEADPAYMDRPDTVFFSTPLISIGIYPAGQHRIDMSGPLAPSVERVTTDFRAQSSAGVLSFEILFNFSDVCIGKSYYSV